MLRPFSTSSFEISFWAFIQNSGLCPKYAPSGRFRAHAAPFANDLAQTGRRQAGVLGNTGDGQSRLLDLFAQKGAGMLGEGGYAQHLFTSRRSARRSSVVVVQLHVPSVTVPPDEAYSPTTRNANAVLAGAVAGQRFEPVARRSAKVLDAGCVVDPAQLALRPAQERREPGRIDPGRCPDAFEDESASALGVCAVEK